ncbi:MAG: Uma2 family endonuclease [Myxococcota bacterium]
MTEFDAWRVERPGRWELVGGVPVAMAPERARHNLVKSDVLIALRRALEDGGCTVFGDGMTVVVDETTAYEPDAVVCAGGPVDLDATVVDAPTIVVEVLSPSSESNDSGRKLADYLSLRSVRHYLVVNPVRGVVTHHRRDDDGNVHTAIHRGDGVVGFDEPRARIAVSEVFASLPEGREPRS